MKETPWWARANTGRYLDKKNKEGSSHIIEDDNCRQFYLFFIYGAGSQIAEPVFVNPGIDSQPGGLQRQPYLTYRPAGLHGLAESIPWNRFLISLNVYKQGLWLDAAQCFAPIITKSFLWSTVKFETSYKADQYTLPNPTCCAWKIY